MKLATSHGYGTTRTTHTLAFEDINSELETIMTPDDNEPTYLHANFILHYNTNMPLIKYSQVTAACPSTCPVHTSPYNIPTAATAKTPSPANAPPVAIGAALSDCEADADASLESLSLSLPLELPPEPPLDPLPLPPLLLSLLLLPLLSLSVASGRLEVMVVGPPAPDVVMTVVFDPPVLPVVPLMPMPPGAPVERAVVAPAPVPIIWACDAASRAEVARMDVKCIVMVVGRDVMVAV